MSMGFLVMAATGLLLALGSILFGAMIDRRRRGVASEPEVRRIVFICTPHRGSAMAGGMRINALGLYDHGWTINQMQGQCC